MPGSRLAGSSAVTPGNAFRFRCAGRAPSVEAVRYHHVDVFSGRPYSGNSLAVFPDAGALGTDQMARITRELRHFESIFLTADGDGWAARVFDLVEELDFAGHPVIGAASVLHALHGTADDAMWTLRLPSRTVRVTTWRRDEGI